MGITKSRNTATTLKGFEKGPFGPDAVLRFDVVHPTRNNFLFLKAQRLVTFNGNSSLATCRHEVARFYLLDDKVFVTYPPYASICRHQGIIFSGLKLVEPGLKIASNRNGFDVRIKMFQEGNSTGSRRSNFQFISRQIDVLFKADDHIVHFLSLSKRYQLQLIRNFRRKILGTVN